MSDNYPPGINEDVIANQMTPQPNDGKLVWEPNIPTLLQPGYWIAQGIGRIYMIDIQDVDQNRHYIGIRRGAVHFWAVLPCHLLEDAKKLCQSDHDAILSAIEEETKKIQDAFSRDVKGLLDLNHRQVAQIKELREALQACQNYFDNKGGGMKAAKLTQSALQRTESKEAR